MTRFMKISVLLAFCLMLIGSSVMADDGRINRPPYHFGGDTLFCTEADGCTLLNKDGHEVFNWPHTAIADAFGRVDKSGQNAKVNPDGKGTYGPMQLWAVPTDNKDGNHQLCLIGYDEWGKQNNMCFQVTDDGHYEQAPLPVTGEDHSCDVFSIGDSVWLIANHSIFGKISAINLGDHTVTFGHGIAFLPSPVTYTAQCSEVEIGTPT